jgi:uncharacterized protein (DUF2141 family)
MQPRLNPHKAAPEQMKALLALEGAVRADGMEPSLIELVTTRASRTNGCRRGRDRQPGWRAALLAALFLLIAGLVPVSRPTAAHAESAGTTLYVTVSNVRNSHGHIRLAICTRQTFLGADCPFHASAPAQIGSVTVCVEGVTPGVYAVQAFHDEDDSGRVKLSLLGIPEEGVGFSNVASMGFGAPRFSDAAFQLMPDGGQVSLRLLHFD